MSKVVVMDHPLIQHKIGYIRRMETGTKDFRQTIGEIAMLICYEATRNLPLADVEITTPICKTTVEGAAGKEDGDCADPESGPRHGGRRAEPDPCRKNRTYRPVPDPETLEPVEYYCKLPADCAEREVFVVDPMLATGGSSVAAIRMLKRRDVKRFISCVSSRRRRESRGCSRSIRMWICTWERWMRS